MLRFKYTLCLFSVKVCNTMLKGIEFFSKSGNKYFYDDFTGFIFNIRQQEDIRKIEEKHLHLKSLCLNLPSNERFDANDIKDYLYNRAEGFKQK